MTDIDARTFAFYSGGVTAATADAWRRLPRSEHDALTRPEGYIADPGLIDAVNIALTLNQPLLLTGEPGTGKTQLAYSVASELDLLPVLRFDTKSTSEARDLFYTYDTVGRFHAANSGAQAVDAVDYITYNALGSAILYANAEQNVRELVPAGFEHPGERRSVVLIDEVDKAPRDVPNDVLNEIENLSFRIPELGNRQVSAEAALRPVVIMTSNSEKALPDAFLRRCIYYHLPFPDDELLARIVASRLGTRFASGSRLLDAALGLFRLARVPSEGIQKPPGTAELLNWLSVLAHRGVADDTDLKTRPNDLHTALHVLFKKAEDQVRAQQLLDRWRQG